MSKEIKLKLKITNKILEIIKLKTKYTHDITKRMNYY